MTDNIVPFRGLSKVAHCVHEDDESFTFQIEFQNPAWPGELATEGMGITLTCWKNGDKPSVGIWSGRGSHEFDYEDVASFRNWIEFALGKRSTEQFDAVSAQLFAAAQHKHGPHNPPGAA